MMKKFLLTIFFVFFISTSISAIGLNYVSEIVLLDGSFIRMCQMKNGSVDYCTPDDELNAKRAFKNPKLLPKNVKVIQKSKIEKFMANSSTTMHILNTLADDVRCIAGFAGLGF